MYGEKILLTGVGLIGFITTEDCRMVYDFFSYLLKTFNTIKGTGIILYYV